MIEGILKAVYRMILLILIYLLRAWRVRC